MQDSNFDAGQSDDNQSNGSANAGGYKSFNDKPPMVEGNWKCSDCAGEITKLPFEPKEGRPVYCLDCYRKNNPRRNFGR